VTARVNWSEVIHRLEAHIAQAEIRRNQCETKQRFDDPVQALSRIRRNADGKVSAYRCQFCKGYHLGGAIAPRTVRERLGLFRASRMDRVARH